MYDLNHSYVKFVVVFDAGFVGVPVILNLDTPFSFTVVDDNPAGRPPVKKSKTTLPADSGSVAVISIVVIALPPATVPKVPAEVANTGCASILS